MSEENRADVGGGGGDGGQDVGQVAASMFPTEEAGDKPQAEGGAGEVVAKSENGADKVPQDGKYDLKMPEGIEIDGELAGALAPEFKELGLSNAQAQKLVDKYIEAQSKSMEASAEKWGETVSNWIEEAKSDKEIGGVKWDETVTTGRLAVEKFGTPALREYLNSSGGGNHPEMIRFMAKVGALLKEDNPAAGGVAGAPRLDDPAHILFSKDVVN